MSQTAALRRLADARRRLDGLDVLVRVVGVGHATVDLDAAEAAARSTLEPRDVVAGEDDVLLGARSRIVDTGDRVRVVLLEPYTEGRLAASLARFGQEPVVAYLEPVVRDDDVVAAAAAAGIVLSSAAGGPFGPQRLVVGGKPWGPHVIVVDRAGAATIGS